MTSTPRLTGWRLFGLAPGLVIAIGCFSTIVLTRTQVYAPERRVPGVLDRLMAAVVWRSQDPDSIPGDRIAEDRALVWVGERFPHDPLRSRRQLQGVEGSST